MATRPPPQIAADTGVHARLRQHGFWMHNTVLAPLEPREKHVVFQRNMRCEILKEPIQTGIERPPRPASVVRGCQVAGHFADPLDRFGVVVMLGAHHSNRRPDACPPPARIAGKRIISSFAIWPSNSRPRAARDCARSFGDC